MDRNGGDSLTGRKAERFFINGEGGRAGDEPENQRRRVNGNDEVDNDSNDDMMVINNGGRQHDRLDLSLIPTSADQAPPPRSVQTGQHQMSQMVNGWVNNVGPGQHKMTQSGMNWVTPSGIRPIQLGFTTAQHEQSTQDVINARVNRFASGQNQISMAGNHPVHGALSPQQLRPQPVADANVASARPARGRRRVIEAAQKSTVIAPPYEWATDCRATVHPLQTLTARGITAISGRVQCNRCRQASQLTFNLAEKFNEIKRFVVAERDAMRDRAPTRWLTPTLPKCPSCERENSMLRPVMAEKKRNINWLFLLLGEMVGVCTLEQLKCFCKHTENHKTGAKNRVLYLTYLALCKQLDRSTVKARCCDQLARPIRRVRTRG